MLHPITKRKACVIGSGPNGLAAAIILAQAGMDVEVFEAESQAGGCTRTMELTLPGFKHDFGSAVHPLAFASPFFQTLPLKDFGLTWIQPPIPLAHPMDGGILLTLERDPAKMEKQFGHDGARWRKLMAPYLLNWNDLTTEVLGPISLLPKHPLLMARFGLTALPSAEILTNFIFQSDSIKALFAGLAAHSFLRMEEPMSAAIGVVLGAAAHAVGWPIPRGGSQSIADALVGYLESLGGVVHLNRRIESFRELEGYSPILCDITPRQFNRLAEGQLPENKPNPYDSYRYAMGVFKVDYALSGPIPWSSLDANRAGTLHLGGTFDEISESEQASARGEVAERPFVLLSQPTLFDSSRAPVGFHTAWAYCHVPNGSPEYMLDRLERQIERFAPGFQSKILGKNFFYPANLESMNENLIGGDINGGALDIKQFLFRPTRDHYATPLPNIYLCSSSTPPGGGVHGMCGYHAARRALKDIRP